MDNTEARQPIGADLESLLLSFSKKFLDLLSILICPLIADGTFFMQGTVCHQKLHYLDRKLYLAVFEMKGELPDIITALSLSLIRNILLK